MGSCPVALADFEERVGVRSRSSSCAIWVHGEQGVHQHLEPLVNTDVILSSSLETLVARAIRNAIRANRLARIIRNRHPYFYSASSRFARINRISDSRESPDSRESCESIRANHATKQLETNDNTRAPT